MNALQTNKGGKFMKKIKKLTALMASLMLAMGAVPASVSAEDVLGDWDGDGEVCLLDAYAYLDHLIDVENGTVGYLNEETGEYSRTEELMKWVNENHDITGDGVVDKRDFVIVSQIAVEPATENTIIGDINHDGNIMKIDGYMIKYYLEDVAEGNTDFYTEEQIANFNAYGDIDGDGDVDETDAELIITGDYKNLEQVSQYSILLDGTVLDTEEKREEYYNEFINDTTDRGDVNRDGSVDAIDATMILEYYANISIDKYDAYTEEEHEIYKKYGDVFNDGFVDSIDACWVLIKYAENSTTLSE